MERARAREAEGVIRQCNEGKLEFRFEEKTIAKGGVGQGRRRGGGDTVVLEVSVPRYLDSSLIDLDVHPHYVSIVIKGKVLSSTCRRRGSGGGGNRKSSPYFSLLSNKPRPDSGSRALALVSPIAVAEQSRGRYCVIQVGSFSLRESFWGHNHTVALPATVPPQVLRLSLPTEVKADEAKAQRSKTTGSLVVIMPKVDPLEVTSRGLNLCFRIRGGYVQKRLSGMKWFTKSIALGSMKPE